MDFSSFQQTLKDSKPPESLSVYLRALWYDAKDEWNKAHDLIDSLPGQTAARVHAYLHRKEGDKGNAAYWYNRAGSKIYDGDLDEEWKDLVNKFL